MVRQVSIVSRINLEVVSKNRGVLLTCWARRARCCPSVRSKRRKSGVLAPRNHCCSCRKLAPANSFGACVRVETVCLARATLADRIAIARSGDLTGCSGHVRVTILICTAVGDERSARLPCCWLDARNSHEVMLSAACV